MIIRLHNHRRGFTLIESMAAITVLGALASIASFLILDSVDKCLDATTGAQLHAELAVALDRFTRELRRIDLDTGAVGVAPDITYADATQLTWEDLDGDAYELVKSGSNLRLKVNGGTLATLLTDVTTMTVAVYDQDKTSISLSPPLSGADCDPIRRVDVNVTVTRNGVAESLRTRVYIRSTMDGNS